jgi:hypothetical protein
MQKEKMKHVDIKMNTVKEKERERIYKQTKLKEDRICTYRRINLRDGMREVYNSDINN